MTIISDAFLGHNQNEGEGVYTDDINLIGRSANARVTDQLLEKLICGVSNSAFGGGPINIEFPSTNHGVSSADTSTDYAFAVNCGGGVPIQGSANNKIKIAAGTLLQKVNSTDGGDMSILPFTFNGTNEVTIANGDATHPRLDIVEMKLELVAGGSDSRDIEDNTTDAPSTQVVNAEWRVQCTLQVKAGTPAVAPTVPTPDAGFVPICAVMVGTNYVGAAGFKFSDTAGATACIHDLRIPLGLTVYRVKPNAFEYDSTKWTIDTRKTQVTAGATPDDLVIPCPVIAGRLMGVAITTKAIDGAVADSHLCRLSILTAGTTHPVIANLTDVVDNAGAVVEVQQNVFTYWDPAAEAGTAMGASTGQLYNVPVWCNGRRCPTELFSIGSPLAAVEDSSVGFVIKNVPNGGVVYSAYFYVAHGL
jgi:hypothetical protein